MADRLLAAYSERARPQACACALGSEFVLEADSRLKPVQGVPGCSIASRTVRASE